MVALFVVLTFALLIVIDIFVLKAQRKKHPAFEDASQPVFSKKSIFLPNDIFISKGHTWAQVLQDGMIKVGIDEFVVKALGKLIISSVAVEQTAIRQGDVILEGMAAGHKFQFRSPVDGTVKLTNKNLKKMEEPYQRDWGVVIAPANWDNNKTSLLSGTKLVSWLKEEFSRLKDFLGANALNTELAGVTMHDGGNIMEGAVVNIKEDGLKSFEKEFLTF